MAATNGTPIRHLYLPYSSTQQFFGRRRELEALGRYLYGQHNRSVAAVLGPKGVGKTQLVLRFAESIQITQADISVFWVSGSREDSTKWSFREIAKEIFGARTVVNNEKSDVKKLVLQQLRMPHFGKWLLLVEDVDDMSIQREKETLLQSWPKNGKGKIVFITRDAQVAESLAGDNVINLSALAEPDAVDLLRQNLNKKELLDDNESARELVRAMEYTPRTIKMAAAHINWRGCSLAEYLSSLSEAGTVAKSSALENDSAQQPQYRSHIPPTRSTLLAAPAQQLSQNDGGHFYEPGVHASHVFERYRYTPSSPNSTAVDLIKRVRSIKISWSRPVPACFVLIALGFVIIGGSLAVGLYYSIAKDRVGDGFTTSSYILAVGTLVLAAPMAKHYPKCHCWNNNGGGALPYDA